MPRQYVFWSYDIFPHVLWAEVEKIEDGKFYLKDYQGAFKTKKTILAFLSEEEAIDFMNRFEELRAERNMVMSNFDAKNRFLLAELQNA